MHPRLGYDTKDLLNFYGYDNIKCLNQGAWMKPRTGNTVVIMVGYPKGIEILEPVRRGIPVRMSIVVGTRHVQEYISGQSVVFVAIAFITMMIISLAWLIFYYIQRFLYTGSQFGNQPKKPLKLTRVSAFLCGKGLNAGSQDAGLWLPGHRKETKRAISQLQLHTVKRGEKGLDVDVENCAVCIENYKLKDTVRILPCKHIFHRTCIDPWLLDHRTCPMCKLDVIKALGYWHQKREMKTHASDNNLESGQYQYCSQGDPEDVLEVPIPESISGSVSVGSLSIALQDDDRNEVSELSASSTNESVLQCTSLKEDAGETTALLGKLKKDTNKTDQAVLKHKRDGLIMQINVCHQVCAKASQNHPALNSPELISRTILLKSYQVLQLRHSVHPGEKHQSHKPSSPANASCSPLMSTDWAMFPTSIAAICRGVFLNSSLGGANISCERKNFSGGVMGGKKPVKTQ
ncbi:hypothetical protein IHE44_0005180 [Lamprotornis superbus]|uniref:RING-type domain-containing protein n=1 Tax=Lamprotornis superbus TaxID=245042 RepID=A0A835TXS0_9PASS|nr:hypothetical protein IHE44_0005180 [Lamprotornis superbus]